MFDEEEDEEDYSLEALLEMINSGQAKNSYMMSSLMQDLESSPEDGKGGELSLEALFDIINSGQAENYYLME